MAEPKVLQRKKTVVAEIAARGLANMNGIARKAAAPAVYKPQPAKTVLQAKEKALAHGIKETKAGPARNSMKRSRGIIKKTTSFGSPLLSRTVQKANLERKPFTSATQNLVQLPKGKGYHRRHIISHHLMMQALQAWGDAHPKDPQVKNLQTLLQQMNNYLPNLIPGPGAENSAIGMFTNSAARKMESFESNSNTPLEMQQSLGQYSGFQQPMQHQLIDPVLPVITNNAMTQEQAITFTSDLVFSTDFDWPDNANPLLYETWRAVYSQFASLRDNAQDWPADGMLVVVNSFLSLPKPTP